MNFFTKLLRREASVLLSDRNGQATLSFRYGGGVAPFGDVAARWPELQVLAPYVADGTRLTNAVAPERLPDLLAALAALAEVPRLTVSLAAALADPDGAPRDDAEEREDRAETQPADAPPGADPAPDAPAPQAALLRLDALSGEQRARLEALRAQVAAGRYPDAPLEALLELFAALALEPGADNLDALTAVWRGYIDRQPELAGAPARWIWDYTQVRARDADPAALLAALPGLPDPVIDAALTALEQTGAPLRLPAWVLSRLSGLDLAASRFYQSFPDPSALEALFSDAVAAVDAALRETEGRGLLSARCLARTRAQEVAAFRGLPEADGLRYTLRLRLFHRNPRLQTYLKLLLRYIENGLRAHFRYSGRLQGEIPDAVSRAAVDGFIAQLPPVKRPGRKPAETPAPRKAAIALNMADVARLRADSDAARAALLDAVARDAWPEAEGDEDDGPENAAPIPAETPVPAEAPADAPDDAWSAFLARADIEALRALAQGPEALRALAAARREMPDRLLDALNEAAADTLGDIIADSDGIFEEYLEWVRELGTGHGE